MRKINLILLFLFEVANSISQSKLLIGNWTLVGDVLGKLSTEEKNQVIKDIIEDKFQAYIHYAESPELFFVSNKRGYYSEGSVIYPFTFESSKDSLSIHILNGESSDYSYIFFQNKTDRFYQSMLLVEQDRTNKFSIRHFRKSTIELMPLSEDNRRILHDYATYDVYNLVNEELGQDKRVLHGALMSNDTLYVDENLLSDDFWGYQGKTSYYYVLGKVVLDGQTASVPLYQLAFRNFFNKEVGFLSEKHLQIPLCKNFKNKEYVEFYINSICSFLY